MGAIRTLCRRKAETMTMRLMFLSRINSNIKIETEHSIKKSKLKLSCPALSIPSSLKQALRAYRASPVFPSLRMASPHINPPELLPVRVGPRRVAMSPTSHQSRLPLLRVLEKKSLSFEKLRDYIGGKKNAKETAENPGFEAVCMWRLQPRKIKKFKHNSYTSRSTELGN